MLDQGMLSPAEAGSVVEAVKAGHTARIRVVIGGRDEAVQMEAFTPEETGEAKVNARDGGQLRSIIERVERLEEEKKALADDIKDVFAEAKANGFDTKILRKIISLRKQDRDERLEEEALLETYMRALGML